MSKKLLSRKRVVKQTGKMCSRAINEETKDLEVEKGSWEPYRWRAIFENIQLMRSKRDAPVDTMGCERTSGDNYSEKVFLCINYCL